MLLGLCLLVLTVGWQLAPPQFLLLSIYAACTLAVIALVSLSGVSAAAWHGSLPWDVARPFALGAVLALLVGRQMASKLNHERLQQAFAWFSLGVAVLMLARALGWVTA